MHGAGPRLRQCAAIMVCTRRLLPSQTSEEFRMTYGAQRMKFGTFMASFRRVGEGAAAAEENGRQS